MTRAQRSPLSEEVKAELARVLPRDCDRRVLRALLPRAAHLGAPARRVAHAAQLVGGQASLRRECCRRTYLRGLFLAGGSVSAGPSGYLLEIRPPRGEATRARAVLKREGFAPRVRVRRARPVLMLRAGDEIASFLGHAGVGETLLRFETRLARMPVEVRAAAEARLRAPEATLAEIAARLDTTKWVVRQRLRRVIDAAVQ